MPEGISKRPFMRPAEKALIALGIIILGIVAIVGHNSQTEVASASLNYGYWGKVTATVDWCEDNYVVSFYVAEFYNTISNIFYIIFSLVGVLLNSRLELRFVVAYATIVLTGFGSALFHGTLLYTSQLADELPMFYILCALYYIVQEHWYLKPRNKYLPILLFVGVIIFSYIYYLFPYPSVFQIGWGVSLIYTYMLAIRIIVRIPRKERVVGEVALIVMFFSVSVWVFEQAFCSPFIRIFKLHALWHIGTAYASYCTVTALWYYRCKDILKYDVSYAWIYILPIVKIKSSSP